MLGNRTLLTLIATATLGTFAASSQALVGPNPGNAQIVYDPATGNVKINPNGLTLGSFNLQDVIADGSDLFAGAANPTFPANSFSTTNTDTKVAYASLSGGFATLADLGNIAILNQTYAQLVLTLAGPAGSTSTSYTRVGIAGANNFDLVVTGAVAPEPATLAAIAGLAGGVVYRRRRAV